MASPAPSRPRIAPQVDIAAEFFEIATDFRDPRDAVREAISNAFDAKCTSFRIAARLVPYKGDEELVLEFEDDGEGMAATSTDGTPSLDAFFGLGRSTRRGDPHTIGTKGHGTKTYFNSRCIELWTWRDGIETYAVMEDPRALLAEKKLPQFEVESKKLLEAKVGTKIVVYGYNRNRPKGFSHDELKDFILWKTKFGSIELEFAPTPNAGKTLSLLGIGRDEPEVFGFGHQFAKENYEIKKLKQKDPSSPTKWFVKKWAEKSIPVKSFPNFKLDIVFYIEGDNAKSYNPMLKRPGRTPKEGMYRVEERYGLWACKDFIPVQQVTDWVAEGKRIGTKFHAL